MINRQIEQTKKAIVTEYLAAVVVFCLAFIANFYSGRHVNEIAVNFQPAAHDLLFTYLPNKELLFIHTWGFIGFVAVLVIGGILYEPKERVPYYLWAFALLIIMRSIFTLLTPLGLPKEAVSFKDYPIQFLAKYVDFRHTLFFSGHTAFPFMGFLLARRTWVKLACLGFTFLLAASVLMGRLHYSIDVAAAFFIAYGTYRMCWPIYRRVQSLIGFCLKAPIKRQADAVGGKSGF